MQSGRRSEACTGGQANAKNITILTRSEKASRRIYRDHQLTPGVPPQPVGSASASRGVASLKPSHGHAGRMRKPETMPRHRPKLRRQSARPAAKHRAGPRPRRPGARPGAAPLIEAAIPAREPRNARPVLSPRTSMQRAPLAARGPAAAAGGRPPGSRWGAAAGWARRPGGRAEEGWGPDGSEEGEKAWARLWGAD